MLRRCLLTGAVVLIAGAAAPTVSDAAGPDPAAFIDNLDKQLQAVVSSAPARTEVGAISPAAL